MGVCASTLYKSNQPRLLTSNGSSSSMAKVINSVDGKLQEFRQPIKAGNVLSDHPNGNTFFLCSSETMFVNCHVPHVPGDEELQAGQIYFLMPMSKSNKPLSLQELCLLAITASSALEKKKSSEMKKKGGTASFSGRRKTKSNRNARGNQKVDFQVALKKLA